MLRRLSHCGAWHTLSSLGPIPYLVEGKDSTKNQHKKTPLEAHTQEDMIWSRQWPEGDNGGHGEKQKHQDLSEEHLHFFGKHDLETEAQMSME